MKKIWTKSVFEFNKETKRYERNDEESLFYYVSDDAPMAYCGGSPSGGGGETTTVQKSDPWPEQQPYLVKGFQNTEQQFLNSPPPQFYPGNTTVPFSPETNTALEMQAKRAINGSPIQAAGTDQLTQTLNGNYLNQVGDLYNNPVQQMVNSNVLAPTMRGDYLYGGPGFDAAFQAASNKILPQVASSFERSGRRNSGLADIGKTQALSDAFAGLYGQERQNQMNAAQMGQQGTDMFLSNVGRERENQMRGMMFAPQMASLDYQDTAKLAEVGAQRESLNQQQLAESIARHDYEQNAKNQQLMQYMNLIQGNYGGTGTSISSGGASGGGKNPILGGLGGLASSYVLGTNPMAGLAMGLLGSF
jgi:hypothetical protein